jgi:NitT/TauT family transport system ATP-binding protein
LLVDEPCSAVDAITRQRLQDELIRIWQASGAAILFVTHDIAEAVYLGDRVIVLAGAPETVIADISVKVSRPRVRKNSCMIDIAATAASYLQGS